MKHYFLFFVRNLGDEPTLMMLAAESVTVSKGRKADVLNVDGLKITVSGEVNRNSIRTLPLHTNVEGKELNDLYLEAMRVSMDVDVERLKRFFERVEDKSDWRAPIDCKLHICADEVEVIRAAIVHFTATEPTIDALGGGQYHVKAVGYRNGPAGA